MTNSPTPTPNPNRRRRLTADELIAIGVALAGIGTILFWGLGQKYQPMFQAGMNSLSSDKPNRNVGLLGNNLGGQERRTIESAARDRSDAVTSPTPPTLVPPIVKTVEVPVETPAPPVTVVPAIVPIVPVTTTPAFTDIPQQFWGEIYITELKKRGILDDFGRVNLTPIKS